MKIIPVRKRMAALRVITGSASLSNLRIIPAYIQPQKKRARMLIMFSRGISKKKKGIRMSSIAFTSDSEKIRAIIYGSRKIAANKRPMVLLFLFWVFRLGLIDVKRAAQLKNNAAQMVAVSICV